MNPRKKKALLIISCFLFIILYLILAAEPVDSSFKLNSEWSISLQDAPVSYKQGGIPFKTGQLLGYFSSDGTLCSLTSFPYMASVSKDAWTVYGADAEETPFFAADGTELANHPWTAIFSGRMWAFGLRFENLRLGVNLSAVML